MTGINRQRREHRKNFLLKNNDAPSRAFRAQLRDFADPNSIFRQVAEQFVVPKGILGCDHLAHDSPDTVKCLGRAQPSGPTSLVSLSICCLIPATRISKNSSRFELKIVRNFTRSISGCVGSCASPRRVD